MKDYDRDVPATYRVPRSYIRYKRKDYDEEIEFVIDREDEEWYQKTRFGPLAKDETESRSVLPLGMLERMLDLLEKLTGFDTIVTRDQAEKEILRQLPVLDRMFPRKDGGVTAKQVIMDVYGYWVQKRSKLKRPLLRRFWPVTASDDTNPHLVFRPRQKEKYKLRKKRQNDMEAFRKMKQLRSDFDKVRVLLDLVCRRERLNRLMVGMQADWFKQRLVDIVDTSGSEGLEMPYDKTELNEMMDPPRYFDVSSSGQGGQKKKRRRKTGEMEPPRGASPAPTGGMAQPEVINTDTNVARDSPTETAQALVVAGQNHGEPAPNFLHPLRSRQSYATSWDGTVPFITGYVDSHPVPTFRFRHRPRVGRGGRIVIDRLPQPIHEDDPAGSIHVYTAGKGLARSTEPKARLLDLKPEPLDHATLSHRIEQICASALQEETESAMGALNGQMTQDLMDNDGDEVLVKAEDWMSTDDQVWGEERYVIGPI